MFVCTNGELSGPNVLTFKDTTFVELLDRSLRELRAQRPEAKYVFVMLEDLCPLDSVDETALAEIYGTVKQRSIKFVSLPWSYAHLLRFVDEANSFDCIETNRRFYLLAPDSDFHTAIITSIWDVDHLQWILQEKLSLGLHDPWAFERPLMKNPEEHYMVRGVWPIVADGFLHRGNLNANIFRHSKWPESKLLSQLRVEFCGRDGYWAAKARAELIALLKFCKHWPRRTAGKLIRDLGLKRDTSVVNDQT